MLAAAVIPQLIYMQGLQADQPTRPNIILIMADDMGYECVEANGGTSYKTPHLNRMAEQGMRFEHGYSQPICTPSRVQIMTGIYNQKNYIEFGVLDPHETTFAQLLKQAGYKTCIAGKWQLLGGLNAPHHFGFDEYCLWQLTRRPSRYASPGLEINGKEVDFPGEYGPDIVSDVICDFIERNHEEPFLVYYPMILPHWPFEPTPDSDDWDPASKGYKGQGKTKYFADMVAYTDKVVGKVVAKVDELGVGEETLIIFTGDNGTATSITSMMGDRVIQGGKGSTTNAGTHVPFIARWTGTIEGKQTSQALVDFSDLLPTLLDVGGVTQLSAGAIDGRSFLPVLRGEKESVREWTYCWYARNGGMEGKEFARDRRYKLYRGGEFFDLKVDPLESSDLVAQAKATPSDALVARKKLQNVLDQYEGTRAKLTNPYKQKGKKANPQSSKIEDVLNPKEQ